VAREVVILRVGLVLSPGFANPQLLPVGSIRGRQRDARRTLLRAARRVAERGGMVNSFGMIVQTERAEDVALDTVIVGSPPDTRKPPDDVVRFLQDSFRRARRIAAVCVGAFILGRRVA